MKKHGLTGTRIYGIWRAMMKRCYKTWHHAYPKYGGRGIIVDALWHDVARFAADMGTPPTSDHTLDRTDNNGPYTKDNCRWATWKEQENNRGNNIRIEYNGKTQSLDDWSKELDLDYKLLWSRIYRQRWSVERSFTTSVDLRKSHKKTISKIEEK
jgi:hypothetical protein